MPRIKTGSRRLVWKFLTRFVALSLVISGGASIARTQTAETLSQVKKVYVDSFGRDDTARELRQRTIKQLQKKGRLQVVTASQDADAVIKGDASIWVTGYYSTSPRSSSNLRQPFLQGFLSVEVVGKNNETLWSYLATPSKVRFSSFTDGLADQLVTKLVGALEHDRGKASVAPISQPAGEIRLNGAGATFPAPLYQKWVESFQQRDPKAQISYRAVGSEAGLRLLAEGKVDFAASDVPLSNEQMSEARPPALHFATVMGAVVPIYNVKGINWTIHFTPEVLAGIYLGKIKNWSDAKIRESNRNRALPDREIAVVHRSDGSGTTFAWTDYLSKVSLEWKDAVGVGAEIKWPVGTGAEGNDAVATLVQQTPNSIGYVELAYALRHQLSFGAVRNAAGEFEQADLASLTVAGNDAAHEMTSDFRVSITNAPEQGAYPISTFTWWVLPGDLGGPVKKAAYLELLQWVLTSGQRECSALGYAPLPREIASREMQFVNSLK
jgi:phosphate ABC transporter phosphate-binding protein